MAAAAGQPAAELGFVCKRGRAAGGRTALHVRWGLQRPAPLSLCSWAGALAPRRRRDGERQALRAVRRTQRAQRGAGRRGRPNKPL